MKIKYLVICVICLLTGCQATAPLMKNSITFVVGPSDFEHNFVFKNNWPLCRNFYDSDGNMPVKRKTKYLTTDNTCKVSPEGYVPEQIIIEYAPWLTYEEQIKKDMVFLKNYVMLKEKRQQKKRLAIMAAQQEGVAKIPATAWNRIVLTPPQEVEKYKYQVSEGKGNRSQGKEIHYLISLNPDGSYDIKTKLYWVSKYQEFWN